MKSFFSKLLTLWIYLRNPSVPSQQRWFLRFGYYGAIRQLRYFIKDYIIKRPYKVITFEGEFQQELINALPFAYWHFKNGTLLRTESSLGTSPFYFFSPNHVERFSIRDWQKNINVEIPNAPHNNYLNKQKWHNVPLKEHYANNTFLFDKPMVVIANRFNTEWGSIEPISFIDINTLEKLIKLLKDHYTIVYNRPLAQYIVGDNSSILELGDYSMLRSFYPEVIILNDLFEKSKSEARSFNQLQLLVYANCDKFISVHGGTATLASYFGGTNIILSAKGHEHALDEFNNVFSDLASTKIIHCKSCAEMLSMVSLLYSA